MERQRLALAGITLVLVTVGLFIGATLELTPPNDPQDGDLGDDPVDPGGMDPDPSEPTITRYTADTDLLELDLEAPASWSFEMSDNTTLVLGDLRGQVVLVDLMTTWCSTCKTQNLFLEVVNEDLAGILVIVSLTVDALETKEDMANYVSFFGHDWAHGVDTDDKFEDYFDVTTIPTMILIDGNGIFRWLHRSYWSIESITETVLSIA
jgi:thiol-disulfide isomerase/thioredoxin